MKGLKFFHRLFGEHFEQYHHLLQMVDHVGVHREHYSAHL
jgi:hypothetical protein